MNKILLLLIMLFGSANAEYEKLKEYKQNSKNTLNKSQKNTSEASEMEKKYKNYIEISYKDINTMNTEQLEEKYGIYLWLCIADGICVFKSKKNQDMDLLIQTIQKEEPDIDRVKKYYMDQFKPF
ncbi:hypothetical protein KJ877_00145 [bacterium]|nr:hypothetical protein [bacterium]MBU1990325.1 hypothetical protein [bacterium]